MKSLKFLAAAAVLSTVIASPALAGGMKKSDMNRDARAERTSSSIETRAERDRGWTESRADRNWDSRADSGFWPGEFAADVIGGAVGTAGAIAGGAVNTAGAIATAPFGGPYRDSFAYEGDRWDQRDGFVAFRPYDPNGPVCQPGTWFRGQDGQRHLCQ